MGTGTLLALLRVHSALAGQVDIIRRLAECTWSAAGDRGGAVHSSAGLD
jgi:hypothetical protein